MKYDFSPTLRSDAASALAPARSTVRVAAALAEAGKRRRSRRRRGGREARLSGRAGAVIASPRTRRTIGVDRSTSIIY
jgi:hypothetical protein